MVWKRRKAIRLDSTLAAALQIALGTFHPILPVDFNGERGRGHRLRDLHGSRECILHEAQLQRDDGT